MHISIVVCVANKGVPIAKRFEVLIANGVKASFHSNHSKQLVPSGCSPSGSPSSPSRTEKLKLIHGVLLMSIVELTCDANADM